MPADWKSAKEIENDMENGEATELPQQILDLWQRVDELQEELTELRRHADRDAGLN